MFSGSVGKKWEKISKIDPPPPPPKKQKGRRSARSDTGDLFSEENLRKDVQFKMQKKLQTFDI